MLGIKCDISIRSNFRENQILETRKLERLQGATISGVHRKSFQFGTKTRLNVTFSVAQFTGICCNNKSECYRVSLVDWLEAFKLMEAKCMALTECTTELGLIIKLIQTAEQLPQYWH